MRKRDCGGGDGDADWTLAVTFLWVLENVGADVDIGGQILNAVLRQRRSDIFFLFHVF